MSVGTSKAQVTEQHSAEPPIYDSALLTNPGIAEVKELFRYRDLLWQLVSRNIKTRYKRSVLGILWTMLNPLLMMLVLTFVFSNVFRFQLPHYATYALAGLALWNFFAQTTAGAMSELIWGGSLMHRIYIPRSIFAVSALGTSLVNLVLTLIPLFIVMLITGTPIRPALMILPLPILLTAMFALGVALTLSRVAAYFADVLEMYQILLMAWMYLTPIIYPKEILPENMRWLFNLNPMYHLTEIFRAPLLIGWLAGPKTVLASVIAAVVTLAFGWWYFSRKADELAYRI
ncbi:MAG TPA: ABC transporter permease [Blastocatellia bacterium]|nr:ABC transporter permease [Blastocatellia bacterium]